MIIENLQRKPPLALHLFELAHGLEFHKICFKLYGYKISGDHAALIDCVKQAPQAARNHPTDEHFLPLFVALGAAGAKARVIRELKGEADRAIALDGYVFERA